MEIKNKSKNELSIDEIFEDMCTDEFSEDERVVLITGEVIGKTDYIILKNNYKWDLY